MSPGDSRWLLVIYGLLFVPFIGPALLIVGSSAAYYAWRHRWPEAAARVNRHAWIAIGANIAATLAVRRLCGP